MTKLKTETLTTQTVIKPKNLNFTKLKIWEKKKLNCNRAQKLKMWQNTKYQIVTKLENSNRDYTQTLKFWRNFNNYLWQNLKTLVLIKLKTEILKERKKFNSWKTIFFTKSILVRTLDEMFLVQPFAISQCFFLLNNFGLMVNKTVLEWSGSMIPLKFFDKHHNHPVCCGHAIVQFERETWYIN